MTQEYTIIPTAFFNHFYNEHSSHPSFKLIIKVITQGVREDSKRADIVAQCVHDGIKSEIKSDYTKKEAGPT